MRHGFDYKTVQRVTLGSLANDEPPEEVTLFDLPAVDKKKLRISGPFTVKTLQSFEPLAPEAVDEASLDSERLEAFQHRVFEHLKSAGVKNSQRNENAVFVRIDPLTADYLHAEGYYDTAEGEQKAYIHPGPQFARLGHAAALRLPGREHHLVRRDAGIFDVSHMLAIDLEATGAHDLLHSLITADNKDVELELFDTIATPENLLFDSHPEHDRVRGQHRVELPIDFGGERWIARFQSRPEFDRITASQLPLWIGLVGALLALIALLWQWRSQHHQRAIAAYAEQLQNSEAQLRTLINTMPDAVCLKDGEGRLIVANRQRRWKRKENTWTDGGETIHFLCRHASR